MKSFATEGVSQTPLFPYQVKSKGAGGTRTNAPSTQCATPNWRLTPFLIVPRHGNGTNPRASRHFSKMSPAISATYASVEYGCKMKTANSPTKLPNKLRVPNEECKHVAQSANVQSTTFLIGARCAVHWATEGGKTRSSGYDTACAKRGAMWWRRHLIPVSLQCWTSLKQTQFWSIRPRVRQNRVNLWAYLTARFFTIKKKIYKSDLCSCLPFYFAFDLQPPQKIVLLGNLWDFLFKVKNPHQHGGYLSPKYLTVPD